MGGVAELRERRLAQDAPQATVVTTKGIGAFCSFDRWPHGAGLTPVILDDFLNSSPVVCERGSVAGTAPVQALIHFAVMCTDAWRWQSRNPDGYR